MPRLFPEVYPKEIQSQDPEYLVFEMLKELPDTFSVIYSKKFKGSERTREEVEIDFLIFDGKQNLICLEVKGGEIAYNGEQGKWFQNGKEMKRSPDWQASTASHAVIEYLGHDAKDININWALAFPQCSRPAGSGSIPEVPSELILDANTLLDPPGAIKGVCDYNESHFKKPGVSKYQASTILERLLRSVGYITKIGVRLLHDEKQLISATKQQLEVLDDLEINERTAVMGYAGTGKTIIATEFCKRQSERGYRVLLLFYNRMVSNTVRYGLDRDSTIDCATFHSLARRIIDAADPTWWQGKKGSRGADFWEMEVPVKLIECLEGTDPVYDTIIIDEGQDFKAEWIEALENLFTGKEDSRFVVFYDAKQDIFGRWSDLPWKIHSYTKKQLKKNCRNTKAIVSKLNEISPSDMISFEKSPEGVPIQYRHSTSPAEQLSALKSDIDKLLKNGLEPGKIIILVDHTHIDSITSKLGKIGRSRVSYLGKTYRRDSKDLQVTTIDSFKGLEADVVFIIKHNSSHLTEKSESLLYTEVSRACLSLYIYN